MRVASSYSPSSSDAPTKAGFGRFNGLLALSITLPILTVGLSNWWVNPYGVTQAPVVTGWNQKRSGTNKNDRLFKAAQIMQQRPVAVMVGSSRTKQGMDPDTELLPEGTYNLGLNGSTAHELQRYLEHAIANNPDLQQVVVGIDFFMFNGHRTVESTFSEDRLGKRRLPVGDHLATLLSLDATAESWATIQGSRDHDAAARPTNGFAPTTKAKDGNTQWRFNQAIKDYFGYHADYELSTEQLDAFRALVEVCRDRNIDLVVFISPSHAVQWETIRATGHWQTFETWKRELVSIIPVWDFSGYNSITTEPIADVMQNYSDSSHYLPSVGDIVLQQSLGSTTASPKDFGIWLTPENIDAHLEQIRLDREAWAIDNQEWIEKVEKHYKKFNDTTS
ncbi:MAG: hypothetical protein AAFU71_03275 [Cyanobacteria bacterium J06632_22]